MSEFIGQFHPLLVHLPIGFLLLASVFRFLLFRGKEQFRETLSIILILSIPATVFTAITGYILSDGGGYGSELVFKHQWSGIALLSLTIVLYVLHIKEVRTSAERVLWIVMLLTLSLTGHFGGGLTHGENYLSLGTDVYERPAITDVEEALVYQDIIEPVLAQKCWSCHSGKKQKGELRLDGKDWILKGGESGEVIAAHKPAQSELYSRLLLDKQDDDHMPPDGKPQPTKEELILIQWWIETGGSFDKKVKDLPKNGQVSLALHSLQPKAEYERLPKEVKVKEVDVQAMKTLQDFGIAISKVGAESPFLQVNLLGKRLDKKALESLASLSENIVWFNSGGGSLDSASVKVIRSFSNITELNLSGTTSSSGFQWINNYDNLVVLNLSQTNVSDLDLSGLSKLKRLYVFGSDLNKQKLILALPKVQIDTGNYVVPTYPGDTTVFRKEDII